MIISVNLSKSQQATMKRIMKTGNSGKLRLTKSQIEKGGPHYLKLNMGQAKKVMSAMNRKKGLDIEFSKAQIVEMSHKQQGGFIFLPFLIAAAEAAAPYVASAVGGYVADKAINYIGDALFGTGLQPYTPQEGGAYYENRGRDKKTGKAQEYTRSKKGVKTVCFVKGNSTQPSINNGRKIAPQKRGRSTGRPKNSKNKPKPVLVPRDMEGGAWFESNADEDTYFRDPDQNRVVCFEKNTKPGEILPETRKQSTGRPRGSKNKLTGGGHSCCLKKKNKK